MTGSMMADYFTDQAVLSLREADPVSNGLGEPSYSELSNRTVRGLLVLKSHRRWAELGLVEGADAVFLTEDPCADLVAPNTLTVGGRTYRDVTVSRRASLMGDGVTRLLLVGEAR